MKIIFGVLCIWFGLASAVGLFEGVYLLMGCSYPGARGPIELAVFSSMYLIMSAVCFYARRKEAEKEKRRKDETTRVTDQISRESD